MITLALYLVAGYVLLWAFIFVCQLLAALFEDMARWGTKRTHARPSGPPLPPVPSGEGYTGPGSYVSEYRDDRCRW